MSQTASTPNDGTTKTDKASKHWHQAMRSPILWTMLSLVALALWVVYDLQAALFPEANKRIIGESLVIGMSRSEVQSALDQKQFLQYFVDDDLEIIYVSNRRQESRLFNMYFRFGRWIPIAYWIKLGYQKPLRWYSANSSIRLILPGQKYAGIYTAEEHDALEKAGLLP